MSRLAWLYTGGKWLIIFGSSSFMVSKDGNNLIFRDIYREIQFIAFSDGTFKKIFRPRSSLFTKSV
jgi:hypothetical protein